LEFDTYVFSKKQKNIATNTAVDKPRGKMLSTDRDRREGGGDGGVGGLSEVLGKLPTAEFPNSLAEYVKEPCISAKEPYFFRIC